MIDLTPDKRTFNRRMLLASAASVMAWPLIGFANGDPDDAEIARVRDHAKKAGLGAFQVSSNDQYLAIGDAPDRFREEAMRILSGLEKDFLAHFKSRKFEVERPKGKMSLVILADRGAFGAYLGEEPEGLVSGNYDPVNNDLTFFDNRGAGGVPDAEKDNTLVLFHEATHQLTFNTGLLERGGDIPLAIAEGLACYAEVRSPNGKSKIGDLNLRRLAVLRPRGQRAPVTLATVSTLIGSDDRLTADATKQVGYSEAWLLVHYLMRTPRLQLRFQAYLKTIKERKDGSHRLEDWRKHFGDPAVLDQELAAYLRKL